LSRYELSLSGPKFRAAERYFKFNSGKLPLMTSS